MTTEELSDRLRSEGIVKIEPGEWTTLAATLEEVERHPTFMAGDLVIVRADAGLIAVEEPSSTERVLRLLGGDEEARSFVEQRLDTYERMWDGCGCRVEYYR